MKIALCHSFRGIDMKMVLDVKTKLERWDHEVLTTPYTEVSLDDSENMKPNLMKEQLDNISKSDAVLVLNFDKDGIENYIGGNMFAEIIFASSQGKKIFFLNPAPDMSIISDELKALNPTIINGNLGLIR